MAERLTESRTRRTVPWNEVGAAGSAAKTTPYFEEQVLRKRSHLQREWCSSPLVHPEHTEVQSDGRVRYRVHIPELPGYLRVVTLEDGETIHNAFPDRNFEVSQ